MRHRVIITITRSFNSRANALSSLDAILAKVPDEWEVREEVCRRE